MRSSATWSDRDAGAVNSIASRLARIAGNLSLPSLPTQPCTVRVPARTVILTGGWPRKVSGNSTWIWLNRWTFPRSM